MSKTKTTTFRIDENNDNELRKIADENQTSTNTLLNQILKNYIDVERPLKKENFMIEKKVLIFF